MIAVDASLGRDAEFRARIASQCAALRDRGCTPLLLVACEGEDPVDWLFALGGIVVVPDGHHAALGNRCVGTHRIVAEGVAICLAQASDEVIVRAAPTELWPASRRHRHLHVIESASDVDPVPAGPNMEVVEPSNEEDKWHRGRWHGLIILAAAILMLTIDDTILNVALPSIARDLSMTEAGLSWIANSYVLAFGGFLLAAGRAVDVIGQRRCFLAGITLFSLAALGCGIASSPIELIALRVLQGVGAAFASPAAFAAVATLFKDEDERAKALGMIGMVFGLGGSFGMIFGGLITGYASWRWALTVNAPLGALVILGALRWMPSVNKRSDRMRGEIGAALMLTAAAAALLYAISLAANPSVSATRKAFPLLLAAGLTAILLRTAPRALRALVPFVSNTRVRWGFLLQTAADGPWFAVMFVITLLLQEVMSYSPFESSLAFLAVGASMTLGYVTSSMIRGELALPVVMPLGFAGAAAGAGIFSQLSGTSGYWFGVMPAMILLGIGAAWFTNSIRVFANERIPESEAGGVNALLDTGAHLGGALGMTVAAALGALASGSFGSLSKVSDTDLLGGLRLGFLGVAAAWALTCVVAMAAMRLRGIPEAPLEEVDRDDSVEIQEIAA